MSSVSNSGATNCGMPVASSMRVMPSYWLRRFSNMAGRLLAVFVMVGAEGNIRVVKGAEQLVRMMFFDKVDHIVDKDVNCSYGLPC